MWPFGQARLSLETRRQFLRRHNRRSDFSNDDASGVVGNNRRFEGRGAGGYSQRENRNDRVARPRNIEHFLSDRWNMDGLLIALTEQHAQFAKSDQKNSRAQPL